MTTPMSLELRYGASNYAPPPLMITRASGVHVWDEEGRCYLDMLGAYSTSSFGHCHPKLVHALIEQAGRLDTISRAFFSDRLGPFLARACELTGMEAALPMNTGAEATETALKAARKWAYKVKGVGPDSAEIIAAKGNFHGRTLGAISLSSVVQYRSGFGPFLPGVVLIPFGDTAALERAITPQTAAFIVEPIQGEGGIVVPPSGYLRAVERICRERNVLLICDEVQTGMGRTGRLLACEHEGVTPDAITLGKALGGGLTPVSLFLARRELMDVFAPGDHGSTFGGNPIAAAVGLAALDLLIEEHLIERSAVMGKYLLERLREMKSSAIREVRGRGLFVGIEFCPDQTSSQAVAYALVQRGVLTKETHRNTLRMAPPLTITESQIDEAVSALGAVLETANTVLERSTTSV